MWREIKHPVKSTSYGGGTIVPSGIYAAAPLSSSETVIWSSANPRFASPVLMVKLHIADQSVIAEILEDSVHRGDSRLFAEQIETVDWSARRPDELIQAVRAALNQEWLTIQPTRVERWADSPGEQLNVG
jgi:hypothetical protein